MQVNIHEAKTGFSRLVDRALAGEEVVIARNGKALLRLVPVAQPAAPRIPGLSAGKGRLTADFNDPLPPEVLREFER